MGFKSDKQRKAVMAKLSRGKSRRVRTIRKGQYGFDLTDFSTAKKFKGLLRRHKLAKYKRVKKVLDWKDNIWYYMYTWSTKEGDLKLVTGNNPITGRFSSPKARQTEKGYASYMGIEGNSKKVKALAKDIKKTATYVKGENPREREFI